MNKETVTNNGISGVNSWQILAKHGPWAFFASVFLGIIVFYQIKPNADERQMLMKVTTESLQANSDSMKKMAHAVESLNETLNSMKKNTEEVNKKIGAFVESVTETHQGQTKLLETINGKLPP